MNSRTGTIVFSAKCTTGMVRGLLFVMVFDSKGVREFFCQGGGGEPFAQKILTICPNFTKQSKGNEGQTMH